MCPRTKQLILNMYNILPNIRGGVIVRRVFTLRGYSVLDAASGRTVALTESGKRKYILMAADHHDQLFHKSDPRLNYSTYNAPSDVQEMVLAALEQDPESLSPFAITTAAMNEERVANFLQAHTMDELKKALSADE